MPGAQEFRDPGARIVRYVFSLLEMIVFDFAIHDLLLRFKHGQSPTLRYQQGNSISDSLAGLVSTSRWSMSPPGNSWTFYQKSHTTWMDELCWHALTRSACYADTLIQGWTLIFSDIPRFIKLHNTTLWNSSVLATYLRTWLVSTWPPHI